MKLPQLQNLVKRDPSAYQEEFTQQLRAFQAETKVGKGRFRLGGVRMRTCVSGCQSVVSG